MNAAVSYVLASGVHVETLRTNSGSSKAAIDLTGNALAQAISGNAGDNVIDGKGGADTISTLGGKDVVAFTSKLGGIATLTDFNVADDTIRLDDAIFTAFVGQFGAILTGQFRANTTGKAQDGNDFIVYDNDDGKLFYDIDGTGAGVAVQFAAVTKGLALTNTDFVVV